MKNKRLKKLKSVDEISEQMTEEEAAKFYSNHDLADIWDELEIVEEQITVSPHLRECDYCCYSYNSEFRTVFLK